MPPLQVCVRSAPDQDARDKKVRDAFSARERALQLKVAAKKQHAKAVREGREQKNTSDFCVRL